MPIDELLQVESEMLTHVADVIDNDVALGKAPHAVRAPELVAVATGRNRLERQLGRLLQDHERRASGRSVRFLVDVDDDVRGQMSSSKRAVVVHAIRAAIQLGYRLTA